MVDENLDFYLTFLLTFIFEIYNPLHASNISNMLATYLGSKMIRLIFIGLSGSNNSCYITRSYKFVCELIKNHELAGLILL